MSSSVSELLEGYMDRICDEAMAKYGKQAQIIKAIEELTELATVLARYLNGQNDGLRAIHDEIADVIVMSQQMRKLFGPGQVDGMIAYKLHRLEARMNGGSEVPHD